MRSRIPTDRQALALAFLRQRWAAGLPPTLREIGEHMGIRSINAVHDHLRALARKGLVEHRPGERSRVSWRPVEIGAAPRRLDRDAVVDALQDLGPRVTTAAVLAVLERLGCERAGAMRLREEARS